MKVIITGSLGHIGKPLTVELVEKGHTVTVISSKGERQNDIEKLGATAAIGSLEDADFLASTLQGADAVFMMIPPDFAQPDQIAYYQRLSKNYVHAILESGVKRVVHLSSYGADLDHGSGFILGSHHAESILNALSETSITHLRPGYFYYNIYNFTEMIKVSGMIGANYGGGDKIVLVAPADIAIAAAEELTKISSGKTVRYIASDERRASEIAQIIGTAIGQPDLQWLTFTNEQMQKGLEQNGLPAHVAAKLVELGSSLHSGALLRDYELHKPSVMGKIKLEEFAKEFANTYEKGKRH